MSPADVDGVNQPLASRLRAKSVVQDMIDRRASGVRLEVTKPCTSCQVVKPLSDFHRHPTSRFGRQPKCKACQAAEERARNQAYAEASAAKAVAAPVEADPVADAAQLAVVRAWAAKFGMEVETFEDMAEVNKLRREMRMPLLKAPGTLLRAMTKAERALLEGPDPIGPRVDRRASYDNY